jgi:hypothetical protein
MDFLKKTIDDMSIKIGINVIHNDKDHNDKDYNDKDHNDKDHNDKDHNDKDIDISYIPLTDTFLGNNNIKNANEQKTHPIFAPFKLPIQYQNVNQIQELSPIVVSDLELADSEICMYDFLFQPKHQFSKKMIHEWKKYISVDPVFLKDSQTVIENASFFINDTKNTATNTDPIPDTERLVSIWNGFKNDPLFLEKYSYMEFEFFKYLNHSETFLQTVTFANIISPFASLLFPIIILILPFLILKFQKNQLDFMSYLNVLKNLAKNHFIGKTILNFEKMDFNKIGYIIISVVMYLLQIYNNIITCCHFYKNIKRINEDMVYLCEFIQRSDENMDKFVKLNSDKSTYIGFCKDLIKYQLILKRIKHELTPINPFTISLTKLGKIGYMLKCYYQLYSNEDYADAIKFSFGFEGYIDNIVGVYNNWKKGNISVGHVFNGSNNTNSKLKKSSNKLFIKEQYYPPYDKETTIKNTVKLGVSLNKILLPEKTSSSSSTATNGIIITGPNASGKTTLLKTTAINIIFTQQVGFGYYSKCSLKPYKYIHSYLNIPDTSGRDSLFQAEARRCKDIIDRIHSEEKENMHFCIFDELYSGTNPVEATKASFAFLNYIGDYNNVHFMLTTHYSSVCKEIIKQKITHIKNYKMDVKEITTNGESGQLGESEESKLIYTYKMVNGISDIEGAVNVLKSLNYPEKIILNLIKTKIYNN